MRVGSGSGSFGAGSADRQAMSFRPRFATASSLGPCLYAFPDILGPRSFL